MSDTFKMNLILVEFLST